METKAFKGRLQKLAGALSAKSATYICYLGWHDLCYTEIVIEPAIA